MASLLFSPFAVASPARAEAPVTAEQAAPGADAAERPDKVSAFLAARATGHDILVTGETSATSLTYAQPNGSLRSEVSAVPVRVRRGDGTWADVDYDLEKVAGGYAPKASPADVVFSAGGDGPAVTLDNGARGVDLSWTTSLPAPTVAGNTAVYQLTDNEQLVLTATSDGFEQSLKLLSRPTSAPKLRLGFDTTGMTMVANGTDGYDFVRTDAGKATSTVLYTMPTPQMYSSLVVNEEHTQIRRVPVTLTTDDDGTRYADLSAGLAFLNDPATVYPVWIDPAVSSVSRYGDTYVTEADADSHVSDSDLRMGVSAAGNIRRSLVRFNTTSSVPAGAHVTSAALKLWTNYSGTCTARSMSVYPVTESYTMTSATWANQPTYSTSASYSASSSFAYGNEDLGCANGTGSIPVTNMVQAWVAGKLTDYGMLLKAGSETDTTYTKYFCSMNLDTTAATSCTVAAHYPTMSVVYNTYPGTPAGVTFSPKVAGTTSDSNTGGARIFSTSLTPTFSAKLSNADGGKVALQVKLSRDVNNTAEGTGEITTVTSAAITPGSTAKVTVPAGVLSNNTHVMYQSRARVTNGAGGYDYSAWTPAALSATTATKFQLNTDVPAAPAITCGGYPAGTWTAQAAATTSCSLDTTAADGAGYYWGLDDPSTPTLANDAGNTGAAVAVSTIASTPGWHTLYARSRDTALHLSTAATTYAFGVGAGGVLSPAAGASTAKAVALTASAGLTYTGVTYQWAPGATSATWTDLPPADVTPAGSPTPIGSWPLTGTTSGSQVTFTGFNWNVAATLAAAGEPDGALRVRAKFTTASGAAGYSAERSFALAVTTFGENAATSDLGPGTVSLTTGDFQVSAGDSSVGGLSVGRTATSLVPAASSTGASGVFGAGWRASLPGADAGAGDATLLDNSASGSLTLQHADGTEAVYVKQTAGVYSGKYLGVGAANDGGVLARSTTIVNPADPADTTSYTGWQLTGSDGTVTTWTRTTAGAWVVAWVDEPGKEAETAYARDGNGRVTTILAPTPAGVTCTTSSFSTAGCSALRLTYATATTATGTEEAGWGAYTGLVSAISWTGYDPASAAMVTKQVAAYLYDSTGHLRAAWDPRVATALKTRYSYDQAGRIATITPPGLNAWTLAYDNRGRLSGVSRTDPANGVATRAVAYDLPVSGAVGAPDVSGATAAGWGQTTDLAYTGAGVFPASHVPSVNPATGAYAPAAADWPYASVSYADVDGHVVDTAGYGAGAWQIDAVRYNVDGDEIWSLSAGNRAQALSPTADTDPYVASQNSSAARADLLATISTYSEDGVDLTTTLGSAHPAQLAGGDVASVRVRTAFTYDTGAPTTDQYHLVTKTVTSPVALDGTVTTAADTRTTVTGYNPIDGSSATGNTSGWVLHTPTTETTWLGMAASTADLTNQTRYDAAGRVVESRLPGGAATDANTTVTTYYTSAANATYPACGAKPYWTGMVCRTDPGGAPSAGFPVPAKAYTYNLYGQPLTVTETSGTVVRTTTTGYDAPGRVTGTSIGVAGLPTSTAVAATGRTYDVATGLPATTTQGSAVLTNTYDALGRAVSYTDADGGVTTYTYDVDGRTIRFADVRTTTYTYDSGTEHRGLLLAMSAGMDTGPSVFTAAYDAGGRMTGQAYPNGMTAAYTYDNTGQPTGLAYQLPAVTGAAAGTVEFSTVANPGGQTVHAQSPLSAQDYTYDNANRLTQVQDTTDGACVTRRYGFDKQSDRTSLASYAATAEGDCQSTTATSTVTSGYDTANRITTAGYTYDRLGRTLTTPATDLASGSAALTVAYQDTDLPVSMTQGTAAKTFTVDPARRYRQVLDTTSGTETRRTTNHYANDSDSPSWISVSSDAGATAAWSRNIIGIDGKLAAVHSSDGTSTLELTNLHGDVVATVPNHVPTAADPAGASTSAYFESTEYGIARDATSTGRYNWLGGAQRSTDAVASLILMGARLYNPASGRFLTVDSIAGGNQNAYEYPSDPINSFDVTGLKRHGGFKRHWWGISLYLTEWATNRLMRGLAAGSGIAWVAAELTSWTGIGGLTGGAIAALMAAMGGAIWACDWHDRGVGFHYTYPWYGGGFWCWPR
ncbi:DNRLRE domain-containing protein [Actinoplanes sp. NPDC051494]|uniref:DNRLRE domain-containing protein n=1 Tax=Actinoplanes sp. NPDC051494 TaxID=3363907 RepID=UPI0037BB0850